MKAPTEKLEYNPKSSNFDNPLPDQFEEVKKGETNENTIKSQFAVPKTQNETATQSKPKDQAPIKDFKLGFSEKDDLL